MAAKISRRLVIDTNVAQAAGDVYATDQTAIECRDLLQAVLRICHRLVLTDALAAEWDKHQSGFARRWRATMMARKKIYRAAPEADSSLQAQALSTTTSEAEYNNMLKDWLLIEAALVTDKVVISLDETVRALFVTATTNVPKLRPLAWVNPCTPEEECLTWLESGAVPEKERRLGFREP